MIIDSVACKRFSTLVYLLTALVRLQSQEKITQLERLLCFSTHKAQNILVSDSAHVERIVWDNFTLYFQTQTQVYV
jgi:hypothetical protein